LRKDHLHQVGQACRMLTGYGSARYRRAYPGRHPDEGRGRRAQHELLAGEIGSTDRNGRAEFL